ncbi:MAG: hypothetical protein DK304_001482, partial [Chloroflexi bacterium]
MCETINDINEFSKPLASGSLLESFYGQLSDAASDEDYDSAIGYFQSHLFSEWFDSYEEPSSGLAYRVTNANLRILFQTIDSWRIGIEHCVFNDIREDQQDLSFAQLAELDNFKGWFFGAVEVLSRVAESKWMKYEDRLLVSELSNDIENKCLIFFSGPHYQKWGRFLVNEELVIAFGSLWTKWSRGSFLDFGSKKAEFAQTDLFDELPPEEDEPIPYEIQESDWNEKGIDLVYQIWSLVDEFEIAAAQYNDLAEADALSLVETLSKDTIGSRTVVGELYQPKYDRYYLDAASPFVYEDMFNERFWAIYTANGANILLKFSRELCAPNKDTKKLLEDYLEKNNRVLVDIANIIHDICELAYSRVHVWGKGDLREPSHSWGTSDDQVAHEHIISKQLAESLIAGYQLVLVLHSINPSELSQYYAPYVHRAHYRISELCWDSNVQGNPPNIRIVDLRKASDGNFSERALFYRETRVVSSDIIPNYGIMPYELDSKDLVYNKLGLEHVVDLNSAIKHSRASVNFATSLEEFLLAESMSWNHIENLQDSAIRYFEMLMVAGKVDDAYSFWEETRGNFTTGYFLTYEECILVCGRYLGCIEDSVWNHYDEDNPINLNDLENTASLLLGNDYANSPDISDDILEDYEITGLFKSILLPFVDMYAGYYSSSYKDLLRTYEGLSLYDPEDVGEFWPFAYDAWPSSDHVGEVPDYSLSAYNKRDEWMRDRVHWGNWQDIVRTISRTHPDSLTDWLHYTQIIWLRIANQVLSHSVVQNAGVLPNLREALGILPQSLNLDDEILVLATSLGLLEPVTVGTTFHSDTDETRSYTDMWDYENSWSPLSRLVYFLSWHGIPIESSRDKLLSREFIAHVHPIWREFRRTKRIVEDYLKNFDEKQVYVIKGLLGFDGFEVTIAELGEELGTSEETINQLESDFWKRTIQEKDFGQDSLLAAFFIDFIHEEGSFLVRTKPSQAPYIHFLAKALRIPLTPLGDTGLSFLGDLTILTISNT